MVSLVRLQPRERVVPEAPILPTTMVVAEAAAAPAPRGAGVVQRARRAPVLAAHLQALSGVLLMVVPSLAVPEPQETAAPNLTDLTGAVLVVRAPHRRATV